MGSQTCCNTDNKIDLESDLLLANGPLRKSIVINSPNQTEELNADDFSEHPSAYL